MFQLPASDVPMLDAFIYCALRGIGIKMIGRLQGCPIFQVFNFDIYFHASNSISVRPGASIKINKIGSMKRWFMPFKSTHLLNNEVTILIVKQERADRFNRTVFKLRRYLEKYSAN